jgi:aminoglycoside 6'-N-acetyltransferase
MPHDYRFVPLTRADIPMLRGWLSEPHIGGWWGDPETEIALIEGDLDGGDCRMHVVHAGAPFAFVQDWGVHEARVPQFADTPAGTRGVDTFLGDPAYLGRGHARRYMRAYAKRLLAAGAPRVVTDPDPKNTRAVAAYRAAGFRGDAIRPCEDGSPVLVLTFDPNSDFTS